MPRRLNDADPDFGVTCMHGVEECRGNVQELCAMHVADTQEDWWNFVQCLNFEGREDVGDPGLAERCAGLTYVPWYDETDGARTRTGIKSCAEGQQGKDLLKASVIQTQRLGIT
jgi:Gamma interferon inducible lysosomal thiol reductase (GILT)